MIRLLPVVLLAGCLGHGSYHSARTLGEGRHEVTGVLGGLAALGDGNPGYLPRGGARYRVGVTDGVDLGAGLGTNGLGFYSAFALVDDGPVLVSLAPDIGGMPLSGEDYFLRAQVPVLLGFPLGESELTLGPRLGVWAFDFEFFGRAQGAILTTALSAGATVPLGDLVRLVPEVTLIYPAVAFRDAGDFEANTAFVLVEGGLAIQFLFGG